jgi:hypothetical protein
MTHLRTSPGHSGIDKHLIPETFITSEKSQSFKQLGCHALLLILENIIGNGAPVS